MPWLQASSPRTTRKAEWGVVEAKQLVAPESGMTVDVLRAEVEATVAKQIVLSRTVEAVNGRNISIYSHTIFRTRSSSRNSSSTSTSGDGGSRSVKDVANPAT